jgi:hypothetical protein
MKEVLVDLLSTLLISVIVWKVSLKLFVWLLSPSPTKKKLTEYSERPKKVV